MPIPHHPGIGLGFGFNPGAILIDVITALFFIVCFVIVVGVLVVFVRFLLVATKAAEVYVTKNGGTMPRWYSMGTRTTDAPETQAAATQPPPPRTRTPKTPPKA